MLELAHTGRLIVKILPIVKLVYIAAIAMDNRARISPKTDLPFNFGRASRRDRVLFTCERPGGDPPEGERITAEQCQSHISFLKAQMVNNVLVLLDENELDHYESPGLFQQYQSAGIHVHHQPMGDPGASQRILDIISSVEEQHGMIAAHCTHGMGRSGRVAAGWVAARYNQSPKDATEEVMVLAEEEGIERLGDVNKLQSWLGKSSLKP